MKTLFKAITAQLKTVTELKWIDEDKGQMNFTKPPVLFPAALVTISYPSIQNLNNTKQRVSANITVKLCFDYGGNTNIETPEIARDQSLGYYDIMEAVHEALQGFTTGEFNELKRVNVLPILRPDAYKTTSVLYSTEFLDTINP